MKKSILLFAIQLFVFQLYAQNPGQIPNDALIQTAKPKIPAKGAFYTGVYRNMFAEAGYDRNLIDSKLEAIWQQLFYGDANQQRIYYELGSDEAYIFDTGNKDVRSEGMSYGLMICVQMDKQKEFNKLWKWSKVHMQHQSGPRKGYFAWQMNGDGTIIDPGAASDGEEYIVTALFLAANRWGNGEGIYNYSKEANEILELAMTKHKGNNAPITNLFDSEKRQITFVPSEEGRLFTDPSYHLPAFYELWSRWASTNNSFWKQCASESRKMFPKFAHKVTGLMPDYANYDGSPKHVGDHGDFRFDAWRCIMNMAVDYAWFKKSCAEPKQIRKIHTFFINEGINSYGNQYKIDGTKLDTPHSAGLVACNAVGALASKDKTAWLFVDDFFNTPIPSGQYRYYDGLLYFMSYLHLSGNFKVYNPN